MPRSLLLAALAVGTVAVLHEAEPGAALAVERLLAPGPRPRGHNRGPPPMRAKSAALEQPDRGAASAMWETKHASGHSRKHASAHASNGPKVVRDDEDTSVCDEFGVCRKGKSAQMRERLRGETRRSTMSSIHEESDEQITPERAVVLHQQLRLSPTDNASENIAKLKEQIDLFQKGQGPAPPVSLVAMGMMRRVGLKNEGSNCWDQCGRKGGFCSYCGSGACCHRSGKAPDDPPECSGLTHTFGNKHSCVSPDEKVLTDFLKVHPQLEGEASAVHPHNDPSQITNKSELAELAKAAEAKAAELTKAESQADLSDGVPSFASSALVNTTVAPTKEPTTASVQAPKPKPPPLAERRAPPVVPQHADSAEVAQKAREAADIVAAGVLAASSAAEGAPAPLVPASMSTLSTLSNESDGNTVQQISSAFENLVKTMGSRTATFVSSEGAEASVGEAAHNAKPTAAAVAEASDLLSTLDKSDPLPAAEAIRNAVQNAAAAHFIATANKLRGTDADSVDSPLMAAAAATGKLQAMDPKVATLSASPANSSALVTAEASVANAVATAVAKPSTDSVLNAFSATVGTPDVSAHPSLGDYMSSYAASALATAGGYPQNVQGSMPLQGIPAAPSSMLPMTPGKTAAQLGEVTNPWEDPRIMDIAMSPAARAGKLQQDELKMMLRRVYTNEGVPPAPNATELGGTAEQLGATEEPLLREQVGDPSTDGASVAEFRSLVAKVNEGKDIDVSKMKCVDAAGVPVWCGRNRPNASNATNKLRPDKKGRTKRAWDRIMEAATKKKNGRASARGSLDGDSNDALDPPTPMPTAAEIEKGEKAAAEMEGLTLEEWKRQQAEANEHARKEAALEKIEMERAEAAKPGPEGRRAKQWIKEMRKQRRERRALLASPAPAPRQFEKKCFDADGNPAWCTQPSPSPASNVDRKKCVDAAGSPTWCTEPGATEPSSDQAKKAAAVRAEMEATARKARNEAAAATAAMKAKAALGRDGDADRPSAVPSLREQAQSRAAKPDESTVTALKGTRSGRKQTELRRLVAKINSGDAAGATEPYYSDHVTPPVRALDDQDDQEELESILPSIGQVPDASTPQKLLDSKGGKRKATNRGKRRVVPLMTEPARGSYTPGVHGADEIFGIPHPVGSTAAANADVTAPSTLHDTQDTTQTDVVTDVPEDHRARHSHKAFKQLVLEQRGKLMSKSSKLFASKELEHWRNANGRELSFAPEATVSGDDSALPQGSISLLGSPTVASRTKQTELSKMVKNVQESDDALAGSKLSSFWDPQLANTKLPNVADVRLNGAARRQRIYVFGLDGSGTRYVSRALSKAVDPRSKWDGEDGFCQTSRGIDLNHVSLPGGSSTSKSSKQWKQGCDGQMNLVEHVDHCERVALPTRWFANVTAILEADPFSKGLIILREPEARLRSAMQSCPDKALATAEKDFAQEQLDLALKAMPRQLHTVHYEDFGSSHEMQWRRIFDFLGWWMPAELEPFDPHNAD